MFKTLSKNNYYEQPRCMKIFNAVIDVKPEYIN